MENDYYQETIITLIMIVFLSMFAKGQPFLENKMVNINWTS